MEIRTRITAFAHERGIKAAEIARALKLYRSNLSAMDSGRRAVSLRLLAQIAEFLGAGPQDLIESAETNLRPIFRSSKAMKQVLERDEQVPYGADCKWVHDAMLAWQRHYAVGRVRQ